IVHLNLKMQHSYLKSIKMKMSQFRGGLFMKNAIEIKQMKKKFEINTAIEDITFNVKQGEIFGLLGPSGSGKTTTIKILTGQLTSTTGEIKVLEMEPGVFQTADFKAKIGILSDNSALYERLTIYDNLKLFCKLYGAPLQQDRKSVV